MSSHSHIFVILGLNSFLGSVVRPDKPQLLLRLLKVPMAVGSNECIATFHPLVVMAGNSLWCGGAARLNG